MKKIVFCILLIICSFIKILNFQVVAFGDPNWEQEGDWKYYVWKNNIYITDYIGSEVNISIPTEINGLNVRGISTLKNTIIKTVVIPHTIKTISQKAFSKCNLLNEIIIPSSVEEIEDSVFYGCKNLKKATILSESISDYMFVGCRSLAEVNLGEGLKTIGERAFANCENLKEIKLPESLTTIGHDAFAYTGLENIIIPESVEYIENGAFKECENLKEVIFKNSNTIFEEVHGPTGKVTITNAPTFDNSNNIATVYAPLTSQAEEFFSAKGIPVVPVVKVEVNGEEVKTDVPPILLEGRVLIPARAMFEALGAQISWEENTRTVTAMTSEKNVAMQIDNTQMSVNGLTTELDVAPRILINRTLVPARAISESLGATVEWDEERQTVVVTY